ncbi:LCP family protein [Actinomadura rudentiformis]|uniref:LCP family protein n=1 Tax=Actinomadura rudentiformis TaxID=359158 RepID=UPI001CEF9CDA|nr:LCP family protein [Actinomadura rudentiformis]
MHLALAGAVLFFAASALTAWRTASYDRNIQRLPDVFPEQRTSRPVPDPGQNWLLIGSDLRGDATEEKWRPGRARSDTIMVLHVPEGGHRAYVVSVPRDLWVEIPGWRHAKINVAFSRGGPALLTETVEELSGLRIDHVAVVDFAGFERMTDALGGVEIRLEQPIYDPTNGWSWPAGVNHLDGESALRFVRERKGLSGSDLDRVRRQQLFLRAMAEKAASTGTLRNPFKLDAFLSAASESLAVDSGTEFDTLRALALRLARIGPGRITYLTMPNGSSSWIDGQSVVLQDRERADRLFARMRSGSL